jgi:hypothetical protein
MLIYKARLVALYLFYPRLGHSEIFEQVITFGQPNDANPTLTNQ